MWGLVVHTVTMFLCLTISVAIELVQVVPFNIDDREDGTKVPSSDGIWGPWVYQQQGSDWGALTVLSFLTFPLNQGLADGLLVICDSNPVPSVINPDHVSSCIVAMSYMPGTIWSFSQA